MIYIAHLCIMIILYFILSISLNLLAGYSGILSMSHAAFFGIGAYVTALLVLNFGSPFILNLFSAIIITGVLGALIGFPSLKIKDDYLIIVTFAFQIIIYSLFNNLVSLTGGPMGLPGIPHPIILGFTIDNYWSFLILGLIFFILTYLITRQVVSSPFGRYLKAIREDDTFSKSFGLNTSSYKIKIFIISASLASIAGGLYALYITFIDPSSFTVDESIFIISIVIIGGAGSLKGSMVGSIVLVLLPESLRFIGFPESMAANIRQMLYGALLVVFMMFRPQGFIGEYSFGLKSNGEKTKTHKPL